MPKPKRTPLDCEGVRLKVGDLVRSTRSLDEDKTHRGKVVGIEHGSLVKVAHAEGCCNPPENPSRVYRSAAFLWQRDATAALVSQLEAAVDRALKT